MKFAKLLEQSQTLEWASRYIAYRDLKKKIKKQHDTTTLPLSPTKTPTRESSLETEQEMTMMMPPQTSHRGNHGHAHLTTPSQHLQSSRLETGQRVADESANFLFFFERQLEKVEAFYAGQLGSAQERTHAILERIEQQSSAEIASGVELSLGNWRKTSVSSALSLTLDALGNANVIFQGVPPADGSTGLATTSDQLAEQLTQSLLKLNIFSTFDDMMQHSDTFLLDNLKNCQIHLKKLLAFAAMNLEGFRKILKKFDKKWAGQTNLLATYYQQMVLKCSFASASMDIPKLLSTLNDASKKTMSRISTLDVALEGGSAGEGAPAATQLEPKQGKITSTNAAHKVYKKIWKETHALEMQSVIKNDDSATLSDIIKLVQSTIDGIIAQQDFEAKEAVLDDQQSKKGPPKLPVAILALLQREKMRFSKTLLDNVCSHHSTRCLDVLVEYGLDVKQIEQSGHAHLVNAVLLGLGTRTALLKDNASSSACDDEARFESAAKMIERLYSLGAAVDKKGPHGRFPIHQAVMCGAKSCVKTLCTFPQVSLGVFDDDGNSVLLCAILSGSAAIVELLLEYLDGTSAEGKFLQNYQLVAYESDSTNDASAQALLLTCRLGFYEILKLFLHRGANANSRDTNGETALYHCAKNNYLECAKLLMEYGADQNIPETLQEWTPLFIAAVSGHADFVAFLVSCRANLAREDFAGWTAFDHAMFKGHLDLADSINPAVVVKAGLPNSGALGSIEERMSSSSDFLAKLSLPSSFDSEKGSLSSPLPEPREYGHKFLDGKTLIRLSLGHRQTLQRALPFQAVNDFGPTAAAAISSNQLSLRVSAGEHLLNASTEAVFLKLPLSDEMQYIEPIPFTVADKTGQYLTEQDEIHFDVIPTVAASAFDQAELVGRGSFSLYQFLRNHKEYIRSRTDEPGKFAFATATNSSVQCFTVPIISRASMETIAIVSFELLLITPFVHSKLRTPSEKMYWKSVSTKLIGHRGMGANDSATARTPQIGENTVLSFVSAASLGAEYIEFDVQLTKDLVPVIYHDFTVHETGFPIPVNMLTLSQFLSLKKAPQRRFSAVDFEEGLQEARGLEKNNDAEEKGRLGYKIRSKARAHLIIHQSFTTLRDTLKRVPQNIGFCIEIKYPMLHEYEEWHMYYAEEINIFCDRILQVVFDEAQDRPIIFFSFHPEICILISLKQPTYPVFFLTAAGTDTSAYDHRCNSLQEAVRFAHSANLMGITADSKPLIRAPKLIRAIKETGLVLFTYGEQNNCVESVRMQKVYGTDAVIVDSVARIRRGLASNVFS